MYWTSFFFDAAFLLAPTVRMRHWETSERSDSDFTIDTDIPSTIFRIEFSLSLSLSFSLSLSVHAHALGEWVSTHSVMDMTVYLPGRLWGRQVRIQIKHAAIKPRCLQPSGRGESCRVSQWRQPPHGQWAPRCFPHHKQEQFTTDAGFFTQDVWCLGFKKKN